MTAGGGEGWLKTAHFSASPQETTRKSLRSLKFSAPTIRPRIPRAKLAKKWYRFVRYTRGSSIKAKLPLKESFILPPIIYLKGKIRCVHRGRSETFFTKPGHASPLPLSTGSMTNSRPFRHYNRLTGEAWVYWLNWGITDEPLDKTTMPPRKRSEPFFRFTKYSRPRAPRIPSWLGDYAEAPGSWFGPYREIKTKV